MSVPPSGCDGATENYFFGLAQLICRILHIMITSNAIETPMVVFMPTTLKGVGHVGDRSRMYILAEKPYLFPPPHLEKSLFLPLIFRQKIPVRVH